MDDRELERILKHGFTEGTESFREGLLSRCLAVIDANGGRELSDDELGLLAAAGDPAEAVRIIDTLGLPDGI